MTLQNTFNNVLVANLLMSLGSDAPGDVYYRNASGFLTRIPVGTTGQALISNGNIPLWGFPDLADGQVTLAKLQTVSTGVLLGRSTAGTGVVEQLSATNGRTILGLGTAATANTGTAAGNVPVLQAGGTLDPAIMPSISVTSVQVVADQTARLALANVQPGDVAKQTDNGISYILAATPASTASNWVSLGDTAIDAGDIVSGIIAVSRLGTGTANNTTVLYGDGVWRVPPAGGSSFTWTEVTTTAGTMSPNNGYIANNPAQVVLTLPVTAAQGTVLRVAGLGAGGWRIAQNAGQQIHYLAKSTTAGATGRIETETTSTQSARACMKLLCVGANTTWVVVSSTGTVDVV